MHVVIRKHLLEACDRYPDAAKELRAWMEIARQARWSSFFHVRQNFKDADVVDQYVVFNIRRNRYRLITIIHYSREKDGWTTEGHVYIRSLLTHQEYNDRKNWDKGVRR